MVGNLFSNFYEEYVYRCVLIAVLTKCFSSSKFALVCSAIIFTLGHLFFPWILLAVVFLAGLLWGSLVLKFKRIFPAWISHCIADFIADTVFDQ